MDFRQLNYVLAIAREETITQAAKSLYISQPSLTKFLQSLESEIGVPLFTRVGKQYRLTYAGERYVETAKKILDLKNQLDRELLEIVQQNVGMLRVAFPLVRGMYILPQVLPRFRETYPKVKIQVNEVNSKLLEGMLLQGDIDLAFFSHPIENDGIDFEPIASEEYVLILSPHHPLAKEGVPREGCRYPWIDIRRFANEDFITLEGSQRSKAIAENIFQDFHIKPNTALTLRNLSTLVQLVYSGYGFSLVLESHVLHTPKEHRPLCFSIGEPCITLTSIAAFRKGGYHPQYEKDFIALVKDLYSTRLLQKPLAKEDPQGFSSFGG